MTDGTLTDDEVEADLERLILRMRQGPLPPFDATAAAGAGPLFRAKARRLHALCLDRGPRSHGYSGGFFGRRPP